MTDSDATEVESVDTDAIEVERVEDGDIISPGVKEKHPVEYQDGDVDGEEDSEEIDRSILLTEQLRRVQEVHKEAKKALVTFRNGREILLSQERQFLEDAEELKREITQLESKVKTHHKLSDAYKKKLIKMDKQIEDIKKKVGSSVVEKMIADNQVESWPKWARLNRWHCLISSDHVPIPSLVIKK